MSTLVTIFQGGTGANTAANARLNLGAAPAAAYNLANSAANTVRVSVNSASTLSAKQLNFVNTSTISVSVTDAADGNANVQFNVGFSGINVNEDSANTTRFITFSSANTGVLSVLNVSSSKLTFNPNTGTVGATNFNSLSDINEKNNIETLQNATNMLANLRGVRFNWKETGSPSLGVIAQELLLVAPELVTRNEFGIHTVNYAGLNAILIEAMKDMHSELKSLRAEIENLKNGNFTSR